MSKCISFLKYRTNRKLSLIAATLFILPPATIDAAPPLPVKMTQVQIPVHNQAPHALTDSIHIYGTVKNGDGEPIENAEIIFAQFRILSDHEGKFSLNLSPQFNKPGAIQFSFKGLEREVRSYHPSMGSISFDIVLHKPHCTACETLGIVDPYPYVPDSLSTLSFKNANKLDSNSKAVLSNLGHFIRYNPGTKIIVRYYYHTSSQKESKLPQLIIKFLEEQEQIASERIQLATPQLSKEVSPRVIIKFKNYD